jgi:hypothetical protein
MQETTRTFAPEQDREERAAKIASPRLGQTDEKIDEQYGKCGAEINPGRRVEYAETADGPENCASPGPSVAIREFTRKLASRAARS